MKKNELTDAGHDRWRRLNALLEEALELPVHERDAWLAALPAPQRPLVPMLGAMLARASVDTDSFLSRPISLALDGLRALDAPEDQPGDLIGPWRLLRELGAGGMATVWLAERSDGALRRSVALKLPNAGWALGLAQRMSRERDILATLEHPNIARLYDAGVTAEGRPWLAMECVEGQAIDAYCREHALPVEARLRLVLQVAQALAHAHARLVVHRDLKPGNILVTPQGDARLLDFGVAKLLDDDGAAPRAGDLTQLIGRAVTPDYAAPEQVAGRPVTVATDVYSLGVVLYELLTGQRPYRLARRSAAALEEAILAAEVVPASERVGGDRALAQRLRGDLDLILAKAMHKEPARRYGSVEAFAADLQRHLAGEPVQARAPSAGYRLGKFVQRHRVGLAMLAAVATALLIGLGAALWQAREARQEARRAEQVKQFVASIFRQATPREGIGGVVTASALLAAAAQRIENELAGQPRAQAELGVIVGEGFFSLGEAYKAEGPLRAAVARAEQAFGRRHPITLRGKALLVESLGYQDLALAERLLADLVPDALAGLPASADAAVFALRGRGFVQAQRQRRDAAYADLRQAIDIGERDLGPRHKDTIRALGLLSNVQGRFGDHAAQLVSAEEALQRAQAAFGDQRPHPVLLGIERWYGDALTANDRPGEAVPVLQRSLAGQRVLDAAETPRVLSAMHALGAALLDSGRVGEALALGRETVALEARLNAQAGPARAYAGDRLVDVLAAARRIDEALALDARLAPLRTATSAAHALRRTLLLARLGQESDSLPSDAPPALRWQAALAEATRARLSDQPRRALAIAQPLREAPVVAALDDETRAELAAEIGLAQLALGERDAAQREFDAAMALLRRVQIEPGPLSSDAMLGLARLHLGAGRVEPALALLEPLAEAWSRANAGSAWHGEALYWLARAEAAAGRMAASREHLRDARAMLAASSLAAHRRLARE